MAPGTLWYAQLPQDLIFYRHVLMFSPRGCGVGHSCWQYSLQAVVHLVSSSVEHPQRRRATKRIASHKGELLIKEMGKLSVISLLL